MSTQPEALRLAEQLESDYDPLLHLVKPAAAELRRLHEVNQELLEMLKKLCIASCHGPVADYSNLWGEAKSAIAKAEGESNA